MASCSVGVEILLGSSMRVSKGLNTLQELLTAYPSLTKKCLSSPSTLTDSERRLILDLPDKDIEASNIAASTSLSREQLIEKALSDRASLTPEEVTLLRDRFWKDHSSLSAVVKAGEKALYELYAARRPAYLPGEEQAFTIGTGEYLKRGQAVRDEKSREAAKLALPYAKEWIQFLYQREMRQWGFVCFFDAAAQKLGPKRLDDFSARWDGVLRLARDYNGSKDIIDRKWYCPYFNSPRTAFAPTASPAGGNTTTSNAIYQDGAIFRKAFQDILKDPAEYENSEDVAVLHPTTRSTNGLAGSGVLTNTFLVIDPVCIDSGFGRYYDDMRVLAFEADFPVEGRKYAEGYQGFTWVRLDQLVFNFYELRLMQPNEVGMDDIWKAAQQSRHGAFVSMDPGVASNWTPSGGLRGYLPENVLMIEWNSARNLSKEEEQETAPPVKKRKP